MATLINRTGSTSIPGYLVKVSSRNKGSFEYSGIGDVPIGVVSEAVRPDEEAEILTSGTIEMMTSAYVAADGPVRGIVASDRSREGFIAPVGDEAAFTLVGRAIEGGRGRIKVLVGISAGVSSGGGVVAGGTTGQVYTKNSAVDFDAVWTTLAAGTVTAVTGSLGIASSGGTAPNITFDGNSLPLATLALQATNHLVGVRGVVSEKYVISAIPLSIFDNDAGFTASAGTVTSVSGSGAIESTGGTNPTISFDGALLPIDGGALLGEDYILVVNSGNDGRHLISSIPLGEFNNNEGWAAGTVTAVTGGVGINSTGGITPDLSFNGNELPVGSVGLSNTDHVVIINGIVSEKWQISGIPLSLFNNDAGWTTAAGTVTSVSGNTGLDVINSSSNPTISLDLSELPERTGDIVGTDRLVGATTGSANFAETVSNIKLSKFNDDLGHVESQWTLTGDPYLYYNGGNVGIGTTTPSNTLTVEGESGGAGFGNSDGTGGVRAAFSTGYGCSLDYWDSVSPKWGITKFNGSTPTVIMQGQYDSFDINFPAGNVGINDSSPSFKLDVNGTLRAVTSIESNGEITAYA